MKKSKVELTLLDNSNVKVPCGKLYLDIYDITITLIDLIEDGDESGKYGCENSGAICIDSVLESKEILIMLFEDYDHMIVHEIYHAVDFIMNAIGHERNDDTDEPSAYLMGHIYENVMAFLKRTRKKPVKSKKK